MSNLRDRETPLVQIRPNLEHNEMPSLTVTLAAAIALLSAAASAQSFSASASASASFTDSILPQSIPTTTPVFPFACDDPNAFAVGLDFYDEYNCNGVPHPTKISQTARELANPGSFENLPSTHSLAKSAKLFCATNGAQVRVGYAGFAMDDLSNTAAFSSASVGCVNVKTEEGTGIPLNFDKMSFEIV